MNRIAALCFGLFLGLTSQAQTYLGIQQSNYGGVLQAHMNPAFLADNRMKVDVLAGFDFSMYNNHLYMNTQLMPSWWVSAFKDTTWTGAPNFGKIVGSDSTDYYKNSANFFTIADDNVARKVFMNLDVDILAGMVSISRTRSIGFGIKHRTFLNVDHVAPEVLTLSVNSLEVPDLWDLNLSDQLLNLSFNSWMEYYASYAQVVYDQDEHFVKVGGTVKLLQGLGAAYIHTDNVDYNFDNDDTAAFINGDFLYGYSDNVGAYIEPAGAEPLVFGDNAPNPFNTIYKFNSKPGFGLSIGGVYEWRPKYADYKYDMDGEEGLWRRDLTKYKLRASFAINDIGGMRYTKGSLSRDFEAHVNVLDLGLFNDVDGPRSFDSLLVALQDSGQVSIQNGGKNTFYMNLPTNLNFNVDYHIWKELYVNLGSVIALRGKNDPNKTAYQSYVALTPRYDYKWAGVSLPMSYGGKLEKFRIGAGLRLGPFTIGTSDLKPLFAPGKDRKVQGFDLYFAAHVPIFYNKIKDRDEDKVSDKHEKKYRKQLRKETGNKKEEGCLDIPGVWEFDGCPDTDGDHIQDSEDSCKFDPGLKEFFGCPDRDGDKIIDKKDACPDDSGLVEFDGCPDRDGDKIIDQNDECPDEAGIEQFNGCPDRDEDGVKDSDDLCPDNPGPVENEGCPDKDEDGLYDFLDRCPEEAGPRENDGCPWPDTDGDGLLDKDDKCPLNAGPAENEGCPYKDTDGDGVLDKDDECVNTPGLPENKGCPKILEEEQEIINTAFDNLEFETGKSIIKHEVSDSALIALAELMIKHGADWKLEIAGHTDNVGSANGNLALSKRRAEAVAEFLERNGVKKEQMIVKWFGEEKPIADNDTEEGRQKNRRVEMNVIIE